MWRYFDDTPAEIAWIVHGERAREPERELRKNFNVFDLSGLKGEVWIGDVCMGITNTIHRKKSGKEIFIVKVIGQNDDSFSFLSFCTQSAILSHLENPPYVVMLVFFRCCINDVLLYLDLRLYLRIQKLLVDRKRGIL